MKRFMPMSIVLLALAVLVAVPMYRASAAPSTMPAAAGQKWEYAELTTGVFYIFTTANFYASAGMGADGRVDPANELLAQLAGKLPTVETEKSRNRDQTRMALFNYLGSQGWELVSV